MAQLSRDFVMDLFACKSQNLRDMEGVLFEHFIRTSIAEDQIAEFVSPRRATN